MSGQAEVNPGMVVAKDEQMNEEKRESEKGSLLENQITVMMTGKEITGVMTPGKEKGEKESSLSELGSSPT